MLKTPNKLRTIVKKRVDTAIMKARVPIMDKRSFKRLVVSRPQT